MTLILSVNSPETIWLIADRRLSYKRQIPRDDARKVMFLQTTDGSAILGYAGLGATARGTEPADWMSAVLRGRNLPLEQSLGILTDALRRQFPRHMVGMPGGAAHCVIIPAFLGGETRLYEIDLLLEPDGRRLFRYTRHVTDRPPARPRTPRVAVAGSGATYLAKNKKWMRALLRMVKASDRGQVKPHTVADHLANLNHEVHLVDPTVGPRCIVAWRNRVGGVHGDGGAHQFYSGTTRDANSPSLPSIVTGMDIQALVNLQMPRFTKMMEAMRAGQPAQEVNSEEINAELARLPYEPDESLR